MDAPVRGVAGRLQDCARQVGLQVVHVLKTGIEANQYSVFSPVRGGARMGRVREKDQAFVAAPRETEPEELEILGEGDGRRVGRRIQDDCKKARRAREVPLPQRVVGMGGQRGMDDPPDLRQALEARRTRFVEGRPDQDQGGDPLQRRGERRGVGRAPRLAALKASAARWLIQPSASASQLRAVQCSRP